MKSLWPGCLQTLTKNEEEEEKEEEKEEEEEEEEGRICKTFWMDHIIEISRMVQTQTLTKNEEKDFLFTF